MSAAFTLEVDGVPLEVSVVRGREAVGEPFSFEVVARSASHGAIGVGAEAKLAWPIEDGSTRTVTALVDAIDESSGAGEGAQSRGAAVIRLAPRLVVLADGTDHAVFVDQDALAIAEAVLGAHGFRVDRRCERPLSKRAQRVQAFESDLSFVTRILAEEGILWFLDPEEADRIVVVDHPSGFSPIAEDRLRVRPPHGLIAGRSVWDVSLVQRAVSDKVTLRDFDPRAPSRDLTVQAAAGAGLSERYEHRGGYTDVSVGKRLAQIRLEEHRRHRLVLRGTTNARGLVPGYTIDLHEGPIDGVDGTWILTRVEHEGRDRGAQADERPYTARFEAVPRADGYRPARARAVVGFGGVETMDVTGPAGAEIHTDDLGRSKARFRWERARPADGTSSTWLRSVQPALSGGILLPRVGWQALAWFFQGSPDEPLHIGRLYTGVDPPPASLPGKKACSGLVTRTSPGGGSANGVQMDDTAGSEGMGFTASKDFNERTENDKVTTVTADDTWTVGSNRSTTVAKVYNLSVGGAQVIAVGASRSVNVGANKIVAAASESVTVGGARLFDVGGDSHTQAASLSRVVGAAKMVAAIEHQSQLVTGAASVLVGVSWHQLSGLSAGVDVGGASVETVAGAKMIKALSYGLGVKGALTESFASKKVDAGTDAIDAASSKEMLRAGGSVRIQGADVVFVADTKIEIKAGGVTIKITPASVTIQGQFKSTQSAVDDANEEYD
ncbi:type VI secretion system tip protein TssI/VgrG [Sorangium sp. So ce429]